MVGHGPTRDADGAIAASMCELWFDLPGTERPDDRPNLLDILTLTDLSAAMTGLAIDRKRASMIGARRSNRRQIAQGTRFEPCSNCFSVAALDTDTHGDQPS